MQRCKSGFNLERGVPSSRATGVQLLPQAGLMPEPPHGRRFRPQRRACRPHPLLSESAELVQCQ